MVVIADTSPLNYLVLIGHIDILPELYGDVVIPQAVLQELLDAGTPPVVFAWAASRPKWLSVAKGDISTLTVSENLDPGEREAIALAEANQPDVLLLMDDEKGREEAGRRHIQTTGTLGVLEIAATRGMLNLSDALNKLRATSFHVSRRILDILLERDARRRTSKGER